MTKLSGGSLLFIITTLGISVRLLNILAHPLPLNDGGLFYTMTQDLLANHYKIPVYTSYNQDSIPFAYPPLSFYLTALIHQLTHIPLMQLLRWLPFIYSSITILSFYYFAKKMTHSDYFSLLATLFFSLNISLYQWLIMGGGLTRSLGLIFALLTLAFATQIFTTSHLNRKYIFISSLFLGLTALSHTEQTLIAVISIPFIIKLKTTWKYTFQTSLAIYCLGLLISLPWLGTVITHHDITPYTAALSTGGNFQYLISSVFNLNLASESVLPLFTIIGLSGLYLTTIKKNYLLSVWFFIILYQRNGFHLSNLILSLTSSLFLVWLYLKIANLPINSFNRSIQTFNFNQLDRLLKNSHPNQATQIALGVIILIALSNNIINTVTYPSANTLSPTKYQTLQNLNQNLPSNQKFIILTAAKTWAADPNQEWFPTLTRHHALNVVQGYEWIPNEFKQRQTLNQSLRLYATCPQQLDQIIQQQHITPDYIYSTDQQFNRCYIQSDQIWRQTYQLINLKDNTILLKVNHSAR